MSPSGAVLLLPRSTIILSSVGTITSSTIVLPSSPFDWVAGATGKSAGVGGAEVAAEDWEGVEEGAGEGGTDRGWLEEAEREARNEPAESIRLTGRIVLRLERRKRGRSVPVVPSTAYRSVRPDQWLTQSPRQLASKGSR